MALSWVNVVRSDGLGVGDDVYVNGNYVQAAGKIDTPFQVQTGTSTFEADGPNNNSTWYLRQTIFGPANNSQTNPERVTLYLEVSA
jgi:hypothetical protein